MRNPSTIGRYRIEGWIASGSMGDVYRAHDPVIDRRVAIKILRQDLVRGGAFEAWLERFRREAHAAGHRFHPNIVTILDFGEEEGAPFFAMEYIEGQSLDLLLKEVGRLSPDQSVAIVLQVLEALGFAHGHGIVHRDIKPSNIMVMDNGQVKVADFGVARIDASELTIVGDVLGTPAYMAPEQLWGALTDHRTDLFAAAVVLFETLTGFKPFRGKSVTEIISHMQTRGPEDILAHVPTAPPILRDVLARALAFDADNRFPNAAEFTRALIEARSAGTLRTVVTPDETVPMTEPSAARTTAVTVEGSAPSAEILAEIERDLTRIIGPLARIAVQRAVKSSSSLQQIIERLSARIDNEGEREEFLRLEGERLNRIATAGGAPRAVPHQFEEASHETAAALAPDILSRVEANLTQYIGPIARFLVRQQLSKSVTVVDLYSGLASYIPNERDRAAFLKSRSSV